MLSHIYDVGANFSENGLSVDEDGKYYPVYLGDRAIDSCNLPHLDVDLVRETGPQALVTANVVFSWNQNRVLPTTLHTRS